MAAKQSAPLEFLEKARKDPKISARVFKAVEKGGLVTAEEVLRIAHEAGYKFTRQEFEKAVRADIERRFAAGDKTLASDIGINAAEAPESSCASGCLSYTRSWHPDSGKFDPASRPK